jgi:hypothetical protein
MPSSPVSEKPDWNDGIMEEWNDGKRRVFEPNIPLFQHSNIPFVIVTIDKADTS